MSDQILAAAVGEWPSADDPVPARMQAMIFRRFGGPEVLEIDELPTPTPGPGQVLVRVAAVSVGRLLDLTARAGTHPYAHFALPHVLGAEHAGVVTAVGAGVDDLEVGHRVAVFPVVTCATCPACAAGSTEACAHLKIMGVHLPGAYAQYTAVPAANVHVVPEGLAPAAAAALALAGPVAQNQLTQAGLTTGDWVLLQGASSALGSLTAALAQHLGAQVIATSRVPWKRERLAGLGVTATLDPTDDRFVENVLDLTGGAGVPIAIDNLGDPLIWGRTLECLATTGTVVNSGAFLGGKVTVDLLRLYSKCQRIVGVRTGNLTSARQLWREVDGGFRPVVDRAFPIAHAGEAHRFLESDSNMGRVVLTTADDDWPQP